MTNTSTTYDLDLWVANNPTGSRGLIGIDKLGDAIRFFDPETLNELTVIPAANHHEVAVSPDRELAYASEFGKFAKGKFVQSGTTITVLELVSHQVVGRIDTAPFKGPHAMRFGPDGNLWVIFEETGELGLIDTQKQSLQATFDIGALSTRPPFIEITSDGSKIYVSSKLGHIIVFDPTLGRVKTTIAVPRGTEGIALSPDSSRLYAAENTEQNLLEIDTRTDKVLRAIPLKGAVLSNPNTSRLIRLRFSPDGRYLVSTNYASGVMHIHDGKDPAQHELIAVAKGPQGIAFDPSGKHVLISNHDCGLFTLIDLATSRPVKCVSAGIGIEGLTYY